LVAVQARLAMADEPAAADAAAIEQFERSVRPLLAEHCWKCHSGDEPKGELRLDSAEGLARGGASGATVVPRQPEQSLLIAAVRRAGLEMPPNETLAEDEVAALVDWVARGAVWPPDDTAVRAPGGPTDVVPPLEPNDASLAGALQVWYRADALSLADGAAVETWPDSSGQGRDLAATAAPRPDGPSRPPKFVAAGTMNRRPAVRFAPGEGLASSAERPVDIAGDAAFTILLAINLERCEGGPPWDSVFGFGDPAAPADPDQALAGLVQIDRTQDHQLSLAGGWGHDASLGPGSFTPWYGRPLLLAIVKSPGPMRDATRFYVNGEPASAPPVERTVVGAETVPDVRHRSDVGIFLGAAAEWSGNLRGDVAEAIIYNAALDDLQRAGLEERMSEKYAITLPRQVRATRATLSAEEQNYWAFQPIADPPPPAVADESWVRSPIDRFVLAALEREGLVPAPAADKRTLLRRLSFDLTGLPPTPEEIAALEADAAPDALARAIDRLLDSPHYGERWGRHWLDVVRFAETTANDANAVMRYACRYRNYVIDAFQRDVPYDQFLIEQLAGDLLPPTSDIDLAVRRTVATGYLLIGPKALAETDKEQSRIDIVDDQIDVTGRAMLGLTLGCARCHDHKFDPIPTADYYAWAGIFRSTEPFRDEVRNASMWWEFPLFQAPGEPPFVVMAPRETLPRNLRIHVRGSRFALGAIAPRGYLQAVGPQAALETGSSGRLELARWIASPDNPLTTRVMVNRVWQHHFGTGLVATSDNFGVRGERPSHPELLDWLARRFIEGGWSVKSLHRLILNSAAWQQSCRYDERAAQRDPDNRLLWRMSRRRLDAESIRDALLAASGQLDRTVGGGESGEALFQAGEKLDLQRGFIVNTVQGDHPCYDVPRRSIYLPVVRNAVPDALALFDGADPNGVAAVRNDTTVPAQALYLLNNPFVRAQAGHLAASLLADAQASDEQRTQRVYALLLGRPATAEELVEAHDYVERYAADPATRTRPEREWRLTAWQSFCHTLFCTNEFLYLE
jgi:hypothetical protein